LRDLGDLAGAKAHFERALAIGEAALGPEHPTVATVANNLGVLLQELGEENNLTAYRKTRTNP
jgi:hypothetical protein